LTEWLTEWLLPCLRPANGGILRLGVSQLDGDKLNFNDSAPWVVDDFMNKVGSSYFINVYSMVWVGLQGWCGQAGGCASVF
jgi:hypothetical protein